MENNQDFVIAEGVLTKYKGPGGDVTIPAAVKKIGDGAFKDCAGLTSISIPGSVTKIGNDAFKKAASLQSITIPASATEIGSRVFDGCEALTIHAPAGSCAEQYAKSLGIKFEVTEE